MIVIYSNHSRIIYDNTGCGPGRAEGLDGCGHSKIARVYAYWVAASDLYVLYVVSTAD